MNGPLRQSMHPASGLVQSPNNMLAIGNPSFMQNSAHMVQPSLGQGMGVPQNMNPSNPPMGILAGGPVPPNITPRYAMQPNPMLQQHQAQQQRPAVLRQGQNPAQLNPAANTSHMQQVQSVQFPGNIPGANNLIRRVPSQPQSLPMGGMPNPAGGNMGLGMGIGGMGLGMQPNLPPQMRQPPHPNQQNVRMQAQPPMMQSTDMRNPPPNQGMSPGMTRTPSTPIQVMNSLPQPPSIGSMPHNGMQPPHQQNTFTNGGPMPSQQPPPQLSSSPRPPQSHTPGMSMGTPGPSHTPVNRTRMTPDNSYLGYPGSQFPSNPSRMSNPNPGNYPSFAPPSTPPMQMDIQQSSPGMMHTQGTPTRSFPGSQFEMIGNNSMEMYPSSFGMPPPPSVPHPRPPSHTNPHPSPQQLPNQQQQPSSSQQQHQPHHQSPPHSDQMNSHPQRPQSQPQQAPGRPPSQAATRTPRSAQMSLPPGGLPGNLQGPLTALGRLPASQQTQGPPVPTMPAIAPRPPVLPGGVPPPPPLLGSSGPMQGDVTPSGQAAPQRAVAPASGNNHGIIRLLQFSGVLSGDNIKNQKFQLHFWNDVVKEYFTPKAVMKLTLWRDNLRTEAKPFEIGVPILPRFFLVTTQSGVKSMTLSFDGARERVSPSYPGRTVVECISAIWTYRYTNGYTVMLKGPLTLSAILTQGTPANNRQGPQFVWKFDDFNFDANAHEKFISLEYILGNRVIDNKPPSYAASMAGMSSQAQMQQHHIEEDKRCEEPRVLIDHGSIPGEPVNAFGIPQATMRCLELAESVSSMADLIAFANDTKLGPLDALKSYANKIRESMAMGGPMQPMNPLTQNNNGNNNNSNNNNTSLGPPYSNYPSSTAMGHTPAVTLYSSAPASITNPQPPNPPSSMNSPQNTSSSSSVNSPEKQPKTIPQQAQTPSQSGPASSPAVSSGGTTNNTPAMANSSLKRKPGDASSPTVGNSEQQPAKRGQRKKVRTGTG